MKRSQNIIITLALLMVLGGGILLLERAEAQAHDTTRKHHIEDIENSLYFARNLHGTYPPYQEDSWCGVLNDPKNRAVRDQVEEALRTQHEKYENPDKPFPKDPLADLSPREALPAKRSSTSSRSPVRRGISEIWAKWDQESTPDYFYWKRSPSSFELYSVLEVDPSGERSTTLCKNGNVAYDYGITSTSRESYTPTLIEAPI